MDNLGKGCASEDCTQILKIQAGKDAIACTKAQQAKEDVGNSKCTWCLFLVVAIADSLTRAYGDSWKRPSHFLSIKGTK